MKVLIVDDSNFVTKAMQTIMEDLQFQVVGIAHDGLEALECFAKQLPDLTMLDVTMPNMDGLECLCKIKQSFPDARVVMLSAIQDEHTKEKCIEAGAAGFLQKPIRRGNLDDMGRLYKILEKALQKVG